MYFENMNRSLVSAADPKWQTDIIKRIEEDYSDAAKKINKDYREALLSVLSNEKVLAGPAAKKIAKELPRYAFVKGIAAPDGARYDAQIDLLLCRVDFIKILED